MTFIYFSKAFTTFSFYRRSALFNRDQAVLAVVLIRIAAMIAGQVPGIVIGATVAANGIIPVSQIIDTIIFIVAAAEVHIGPVAQLVVDELLILSEQIDQVTYL